MIELVGGDAVLNSSQLTGTDAELNSEHLTGPDASLNVIIELPSIILEIDGGDSSDDSQFEPINGLLDGGDS